MQKSKPHTLNPEKWVYEYGDYLYGFAMSRLSSKDLAQDLLQDTFLAAYKSKDNFKGNSNEKTWLVSILKRKIFDHYRKKSRNIEYSMGFDSPFVQDKFMHGQWREERVPKPWEDNDDWSQDEEFIRILRKCIEHLPEKWKSVFTLKHIDEIKNDEIIKELDISESNIWVIVHRSKVKLRECIQQLLDNRN